MIEIIKKALRNKSVISLCVGKVDWDKRVIGYVTAVNNNSVIIEVVDIYGGVIKNKRIAINSIAVIEIDDSYNKHLEKLKKHAKVFKKTKPLYFYNKGDGFIKKLELLRDKATVCTVFFGTEYLTGTIKEFAENVLILKSVGYRGTNEGETYCRLMDVTKIRYQGPLEEKISFLQKSN